MSIGFEKENNGLLTVGATCLTIFLTSIFIITNEIRIIQDKINKEKNYISSAIVELEQNKKYCEEYLTYDNDVIVYYSPTNIGLNNLLSNVSFEEEDTKILEYIYDAEKKKKIIDNLIKDIFVLKNSALNLAGQQIAKSNMMIKNNSKLLVGDAENPGVYGILKQLLENKLNKLDGKKN